MSNSTRNNKITPGKYGGLLVHIASGYSLRAGRQAVDRGTGDVCNTPPLSESETLRWLEFIARDPWYASQMPVSMAGLGAAIDRESVVVTRGPANPWYPKILERVARVVPDIEARRLVFPSPADVGMNEASGMTDLFGRKPAPKFLWMDVPEEPPALKRLATRSAWTLFSCCASCQGNQWLPLQLGGKEHVACYHCVAPEEFKSLGGRPQKFSLVHQALRDYY